MTQCKFPGHNVPTWPGIVTACLKGVLKVSGSYIKGVWRLLERCLDWVLKVFQVRTDQVRSSQDRSGQVRTGQVK